MRQKQNEKNSIHIQTGKTGKTKPLPPRSKSLRKTNHHIPKRNRRSVLLRRRMHKPQRTTKTDRTTRSKNNQRGTPIMTCATCPDCIPLAGDNYQCQKDKDVEKSKQGRGWIFNKTLAETQALCDDKTNYHPAQLEQHEYGPQ